MVRWGVIGAGNMGKIFARSIKEVGNATLVAVSSLNSNNLETFGNEFNINKKFRFNSYKEICESNEIDAIYISTLNNTHFELITICAKNKKDILCEKPFCLDYTEALLIKKIIEENNVKFFEAIAYLSHPQTDSIFNIIQNGEIGEVESIEATFGFKVRKIDPKSRLFNKNLGGGAILDIGCYPLSLLSLFSTDKNKIEFKSINGEICHTNVDISASANLLINNKINCKIKVSLKEYFKNNAIIYGSKGIITINQPWIPDKKSYIEISSSRRYYKAFVNSDLSTYANQIKNVSNEFLNKANKKQNLFNISRALENMKCLDYWMKNIKSKN